MNVLMMYKIFTNCDLMLNLVLFWAYDEKPEIRLNNPYISFPAEDFLWCLLYLCVKIHFYSNSSPTNVDEMKHCHDCFLGMSLCTQKPVHTITHQQVSSWGFKSVVGDFHSSGNWRCSVGPQSPFCLWLSQGTASF